MSEFFGAAAHEWYHFALNLGLEPDMLPVVSNPHAAISPKSTLRTLGKTPSFYNRSREVVGVTKWTSHLTTPKQLDQWSQEPDYGISIQCRTIRAIDIDIDSARADDVVAVVGNSLGANLPRRVRANSRKTLLAFRYAGPFPKRIIRCDGGAIEFLGDGQQFVALGTHPSGSRYEWLGGLPDEIPELTEAGIEAVFKAVVEAFAIEAPKIRRVGSGAMGGGAGGDDDDEGAFEGAFDEDPVAQWLESNWESYGVKDNKLFVVCPWRDGHSSDSGPTEASWMVAGTGGYQQGHFNCLHASCAGRRDGEFLDAVGYSEGQFDTSGMGLGLGLDAGVRGASGVEVVVDAIVAAARSDPGRDPATYGFGSFQEIFEREAPLGPAGKNGYESNMANLIAAIGSPSFIGWFVAYDAFLDEVMVCEVTSFGLWQRLTDNHITRFRQILDNLRFVNAGKSNVSDAVLYVASWNSFDSAQRWLTSVVWDGVPRMGLFAERIFGAGAGAYATAVTRYLFTALAGRVMDPGCQADMALILTGLQGARKTSFVRSLVPSIEQFFEMNFHLIGNKDLPVLLRGKLLAELCELQGMGARTREEVKSFITRRHEDWVPKWATCASRYHRRVLFIGTTNADEFLSDPTGERRWLPIEVVSLDIDWVQAHRDQLWAEGLAIWKAEGVDWADAERLAREEHSKFRVEDSWESRLERWATEAGLDSRSPAQAASGWALDEVARDALRIEPGLLRKAEELRLANALKAIGWVKYRGVGGRKRWRGPKSV